MDYAAEVLKANPSAVAKLIRLLDDQDPIGADCLKSLYAHTGKAFVIGFTGPPGAGKSSLVSCLIGEIRQRGLTVAVLAIDPTSPYSGGALLGDRLPDRLCHLDL